MSHPPPAPGRLVVRVQPNDRRWVDPHHMQCPQCACVSPLDGYDVMGCNDVAGEMACPKCQAAVIPRPVILMAIEIVGGKLRRVEGKAGK